MKRELLDEIDVANTRNGANHHARLVIDRRTVPVEVGPHDLRFKSQPVIQVEGLNDTGKGITVRVRPLKGDAGEGADYRPIVSRKN